MSGWLMGRKPIERKCKICGASLGFYTRRKYCDQHLREILVQNILSLRLKRGEIYEKWRRNIIKGIKRMEVK